MEFRSPEVLFDHTETHVIAEAYKLVCATLDVSQHDKKDDVVQKEIAAAVLEAATCDYGSTAELAHAAIGLIYIDTFGIDLS